jgi:hypothetical protein
MYVDMIKNNKELVTINEAREIAKISRRTIYNWMRLNKCDWTRVASGNIRIIKDSLFRLNDVSARD